MYSQTLERIRECIRERRYIMTTHAEEEMDDDGLSIFDIERAILTGTIIERQKDRNTNEWKFLIRGESMRKAMVVVVTKLSPTGKLVIITVFLE